MLISELGGEFALLKRVLKQVDDPSVVVGPRDDCAVLEHTTEKHLIVTTDMMVEEDHFSLKWHSPKQIGRKLMEANVSDIVSMGGDPKYALVSMSIKRDTTVEFVEELYKGMYESAKRHGVLIVGGDTTHGTEYVFNIALLGEVDKELMRLRSDALPGDTICVTGHLGSSTAGLKLLLPGKEGYVLDHLEPSSRTSKEAKTIAKYANAMIDVSDGLASEVRHICEESGVGALIEFEKIPIIDTTLDAAGVLSLDPYDFALYGGEDFELVFTMPEGKIEELRKEFSDFTAVGKILKKEEGTHLLKEGKKIEMKKGYDHFSA
jgi:thiamine-monophosphate kinase